MIKSQICALLVAIILNCTLINAQEILQPNYGLKNPETLEVIRIRITDDNTIIDMSLQNRVEGGYFCIDENTFIEYGNGKKLKMENVNGLPICPSTYEFSSIGEKVYFTLTFNSLPDGIEWFDIVEYCGDNCFSVLAVNLNEDINTTINTAFNAMDRFEAEEAMEVFRNILPSLQSNGHGLTGSVYLNLIELLKANNLDEELRQLISNFKASSMPNKERYLEILNNKGY